MTRWGIFNNVKLPYEFCCLLNIQLSAKRSKSNTNVVKVLDFCERRSSYVLIMERLADGVDLLDFLNEQSKNLSEQVARNIFKQVINAAEVCLRNGIFHRDFKDENLIIDRYTHEIRLIDFGCAVDVSVSTLSPSKVS